ncbi:MAG TPA: kelch repeat-containing protein [Bryobacteraceae bacterium]|nr:kelch repeat-containing protein [Bryobacteraceae bacterium]
MSTPRAGHTATLLHDGKVLVAGGWSYGFPTQLIASAELYDPGTGTFTTTGSMTTPRAGHTATLLPDGRVLIAGGRYGAEVLATAELYDPSTGAFAPTGTMNAVRGLHAATLLSDGRVLVTACAVPCTAAAAELYDPIAGSFTAAGTPGTGGGAATLLADGRVLITGACDGRAQLFDPATGMFSATGVMTSHCNINTATLLTNGKVLFAGNAENDGFPADAELYDPTTGTFARLGHTIWPHEFSAATLIPDGTVLITGGQLPGGSGNSGAELYSLPGTFAPTVSMSAGRHSHTATLLSDGTVLVAGGNISWPGATASAEIYRPGVVIPAPALLSVAGDGRGQGAILHAGTPRLASATDPAVAGEYLEIYLTGLVEGNVIPPQVTIGGRMAEILFFGKAPGFPDVNQVNVRVPGGIAGGGAVPVRLSYLGRHSNEVTIGVQ